MDEIQKEVVILKEKNKNQEEEVRNQGVLKKE